MVATVAGSGEWIARGVHKFTWGTMATGTSGQQFSAPQLPDKTVYVAGTAGAGLACTIQGSNDPVSTSASGSTWVTLTDASDNDLVFSAIGSEVILQNPVKIRPLVTSGDGTTALTVSVVSNSQYRG